MAFWAFLAFHFGLLGLHFFHFGLLGVHFLSFWPFGPYFLSFWPFGPLFPSCLLRGARGVPHNCQKRFVLPLSHIKNLAGPGPASFSKFWPFRLQFVILVFWALIFHFGLLGLHFLSFWPFGPSFPFILAFWAFICLFGPSFPFILAFWAFICPFGPSFPFILAFWAFISFHFGLLGLLSFHCGLSGLLRGPRPPTSCQKWLVFLMSHIKSLTAPGPAPFCNFWSFGASFPSVLAFLGFIALFSPFQASFLFCTEPLADTGRPKSKPLAHQTWSKFRKAANGQTKVQTYGPPNLEKIACLRQQRRKNRQRADQSPNPWATKLAKKSPVKAATSTKPPTGRPKSKPMGHQTWKKSPVQAAMSTKPPTGRPKSKPELAVDLL